MLLSANSNFDISAYAGAIKNELGAYGFDMNEVKKEKRVGTAIDSEFIKGNTLIRMMKIQSIVSPVSGVTAMFSCGPGSCSKLIGPFHGECFSGPFNAHLLPTF